MDAILNLQGFVLDKFIPFVILLGLLIFVHELGHFLVAKYYRVRVEVFSLGFGKKIFQFVKGHTTYCISLIPLGGYVKMFGDDPTAEIPESEKDVAFTHKPVGQRIAIVLAGPLMNFFFAILLFTGVALNGEKTVGPQTGDITEQTAAAKSGFRSGDRIRRISGATVETWEQIKSHIAQNGDRPLAFELIRDNQQIQIQATPKWVDNPNKLSWQDTIGEIEGLVPHSLTSHVGVLTSPDSVAAQAGLQPLDEVIGVNDQKVSLWRDLIAAISKVETSSVALKIRRGENKENSKELDFTLNLNPSHLQLTGVERLQALGLERPELYLALVSKDMPAEAAGVLRGDKILSIQNQTMKNWDQVIQIVNSYEPGQDGLEFQFLRQGQILTKTIQPKVNTLMNEHGQEVTRYQVGIGPAILRTIANPIIFKTPSLFKALQRGWNQTLHWTETIVLSFVRMLQNEVSPKNIGGIITIGQVASETFKLGLSPYLKIMAIISINLFILNLLPIPILDGGHLLFFSIEALRGAPLSMKKLEIAQQIGLILLMSLMAFAIFNDISRLL